jgi:cyclomaltodextrinase
MIHFRERQPALLHGDTVWLHNSDEAHIVSFLRRTADEEFLIAINFSNVPFRGTIEVSNAWEEVKLPAAQRRHNTGASDEKNIEIGQSALPALSLGAFEFRVFHRNQNPSANRIPAN